MATPHLVDEVPYRADNHFQMVVEIPAGTNEKWQVDEETGKLYFEHVNGKPRMIEYLSYPFNYGLIPQTRQSKEQGGDGDPLDVLLIAPAQERGSIHSIQIIGGLDLVERGQRDTKIIGVLPDGPFQRIQELSEMFIQYPGAIEIIRLWFQGYKGSCTFLFQGYLSAKEAMVIIEACHQDWESLG